MHAIILAAGLGKRLRPFTNDTNKCLVEVGGETILTRMVLALRDCGIDQIVLVTGHCANKVMGHLAQRLPDVAITQVHCPLYATTNNIVSLQAGLAAVAPGSDVLLIEGDLILEDGLLSRFLAAPERDLAMVEAHREDYDGSVVRLDETHITEIVLKSGQGQGFDYSGTFKTVNVWKLSADFCDRLLRRCLAARIDSGDTACFYEAVLADIVAENAHRLSAFATGRDAWVEIDDARDLDRARYVFEPATRRAMLDSRHGGLWTYPLVDFAYPRNQHFPTATVANQLTARLGDIIGHYGSAQDILDAKMARLCGLSARNTVALNGLSQVYPWLRDRFRDQAALVPAPTFGEYARAFPGAAVYDPDAPLSAIAARAAAVSIVVFVNPNNPTGSWKAGSELLRFARAHADKTILVDESFADFADGPTLAAEAEHAAPHNLVILKSLGKALGVAGLRLGYLWSKDDAITAALRTSLPIWNLNALAEAFLDIAPVHHDAIVDAFARTRHERAELASALARSPMIREVLPSAANFITVRLAVDEQGLPALLDRLLIDHGFYLKDLSGRMGRAGAWVRIAVRTAAENAALVAALDALAARQSPVEQAHTQRPAECR